MNFSIWTLSVVPTGGVIALVLDLKFLRRAGELMRLHAHGVVQISLMQVMSNDVEVCGNDVQLHIECGEEVDLHLREDLVEVIHRRRITPSRHRKTQQNLLHFGHGLIEVEVALCCRL